LDVCASNRAAKPSNWNTRLDPHQAVKEPEITRVVDGALIKVKLCTSDNERSIYRSVGMHVSVAQLQLIGPHGSILVRARIVELGAGLVREVKNSWSQASEEQPLVHDSSISSSVERLLQNSC